MFLKDFPFLKILLILSLPKNEIFMKNLQVARSYAQEMGILFMETSAKTGKNVKEVFLEIARRLPISDKKEKGGMVIDSERGGGATSGCCGG